MTVKHSAMQVDAQLGVIDAISNKLGVSEEAFRLLLTLFAGYPIAAFYRLALVDISLKAIHHMYFAFCGILLCYFNYGFETYHSIIAIIATYLFVVVLRSKPIILLSVNFVFHMGYLLLGYYCTASNEYDILWTMPHCILVLRMIGFGFDIADGTKSPDLLSKDQKETALPEVPNFLELMAFAYFPSSFLVGPQYPFTRYQSFVDGDYRKYTGHVHAGVKRLLVGVVYLVISQVGASYLPDSYFLTDQFRNEWFIRRLLYLGLWGKFTLYKYISCWLITEGALMSIGFTFKNVDENGVANWTGCTNVRLILLETGNTMGHYVQSFNVNTNQWVSHYIYKRLRFLNNRTISYAGALAFLAVWHGFHSGYYMAFLIEYMIVTTEKQIESVYTKVVLPKYGDTLNNSYLYKSLSFVVLKSYNLVYMGWCLTAFIVLKYERWIRVFSAVNYFGFIFVGLWAAFYQSYRFYLRTNAKSTNAQTFSQATELSPTTAVGVTPTVTSQRTKQD